MRVTPPDYEDKHKIKISKMSERLTCSLQFKEEKI